MKHSKVLLSGILFAAVTACAQTTGGDWSALQDTKTGVQSRPYYEFGNVVQKISFKQTGNPANGLKKPVLTVYRQGKLLGEVYNLEGPLLPTLFLVNGKSLNINDGNDRKLLAAAKRIDFYDFGRGRIGHAVFTAPNGICQDMKHGKGVSYKLITNYIDFPDYPSPENILIITAQGKYEQDGFMLDSTESRVTSANKGFARKMSEALKSKNGPETRQVNMANAASAEKGRLLADYVCR